MPQRGSLLRTEVCYPFYRKHGIGSETAYQRFLRSLQPFQNPVAAPDIRHAVPSVRPKPPSGFIQPRLPTRADKAPLSVNWIHEIKHDRFPAARQAMEFFENEAKVFHSPRDARNMGATIVMETEHETA